MIHHASPISGVDVFDNRLVATAGYDDRVILWDVERRAGIACGSHDHLVNQCRFSADGASLVSASSDYTARVWGVPRMELTAVLRGHEDDVEMAAFDQAGQRVATASRDGSVRVFTVDGDQLVRARGHTADVLSVEWSDQTHLVSSSDDGTVRVWDARDGSLLETTDFGAVETDSFAILPGTGELCVGNDRGEITLMRNGTRLTHTVHDSGIKRVVAGPGSLFLTTSYDRTVKVWRRTTDTIELVTSLDVPLQVWARSTAFMTPDRLCFGTFGTTFCTVDLSTGTWDLTGVEPTSGINALCRADRPLSIGDSGVLRSGGDTLGDVGSLCNFIISVGTRTLTGGHAGRLFDAHTGTVLFEHKSPLNCAVTFATSEGSYLAVGSYTGEVLLFETYGDSIRHVHSAALHENAIKGMATHGDLLFSVCATGAAAFHRLPGLDEVKYVPQAHAKIANGAAVLPDGRFVSVGRDLALRVWTIDGSATIDTPHEHSVKCVATSDDLIATGGYDGTVGVYNWRQERWVAFERPTTSGISCLVAASAPGTFLAGSFDGHVYDIVPA